MPALKISELPADVTVTGTEEVPVNDGGTTRRVTIDQINAAPLLAASTAQGVADDAIADAATAHGTANSALSLAGAAIPATQKGAANGVASLGADGLVPAAQLPVSALASTACPVGTTTVATALVDSHGSVGWTLTMRRSDGQRSKLRIDAVNDGYSSVDATEASYEVYGGPVTASGADQFAVTVDLNGSGVAQVMRLRVEVTAGTWTAEVTKDTHIGTGL